MRRLALFMASSVATMVTPSVALLSLLKSGFIARQTMGVRPLNGQSGQADLDRGSASLAARGKMIAALERLRRTVDTEDPALATLQIAGARSWLNFMATHPLEARIAALQQAA